MTTKPQGSKRLRWWALPLATALSAALGVAVAAAGGIFRVSFLWEALAYTLIAALVARRVLAPLDARSRNLSVVLLGFWSLFVVGQFIGGGRHTFPFVRYAMFTDEADPPFALRIELEDEEGVVHTPDARRLIEPLTPNRQLSRFRTIVNDYQRDPASERERLEELLRGLARIHGDDVARSIETVRLYELTAESYRSTEPSVELVYELRI